MLTLYTDAACTSAVGASVSLSAYVDHSEGSQDLPFYLADKEADPGDTGTIEVVDETNPGVDNIIFSLVDNNPGGGQVVTEFKLASTLLGLDSAVAGASLSLGNQIIAGVSGAVEVYVRFTNARETIGVSADIEPWVSGVIARAIA
ncbi:hypothetical protein SAMN03080615_01675 [Amphritea atlantica]|uniref:Uncharacterized protein n=1 Tax=Amphritea atlantica TaxID=355243 RepID=A0A1H9GH16_9GAMM|nr:hypothetical protein [Amphritea atlantica]SEQ49346.1 hypothetical protein SAMN03080615_01675 [Amphritea atlantica]